MADPPDRAYSSELTLRFGGPARTTFGAPPPSATDATSAALRQLRDDVVLPVLRSILREDEPVAARLWQEDDPLPGDIWVRVNVGDDDVLTLVLSSASWEGPERAGDDALAARLADALEDWVPETSFGWGQQRRADPRAHRA